MLGKHSVMLCLNGCRTVMKEQWIWTSERVAVCVFVCARLALPSLFLGRNSSLPRCKLMIRGCVCGLYSFHRMKLSQYRHTKMQSHEFHFHCNNSNRNSFLFIGFSFLKCDFLKNTSNFWRWWNLLEFIMITIYLINIFWLLWDDQMWILSSVWIHLKLILIGNVFSVL